jgi:hypothetical protein
VSRIRLVTARSTAQRKISSQKFALLPICLSFGYNGNSYTIFPPPDICIYIYIHIYIYIYIYIHIHILHKIGTMVGQNKIKIGTPVNATCKGNLSEHHRSANPGLNDHLHEIHTQIRRKTNYNADISLHIFTKHVPSFVFVANRTKKTFPTNL